MSMTTNHLRLAHPFTPPFSAGIVAVAALLFAVFLRGAEGQPFREVLTQFLGYEVRATLEHLASAIACPILIALPFWPFTGTTDSYSNAHPSSAGFRDAARAWFDHGQHLVALGAVGYLACCFVWEWTQAYVGTLEMAPRGFLQWEQVAADIFGAVVGVMLVRRFCRNCR